MYVEAFAGLEPVILQLLEAAGNTVCLVGHRPGPLTLPDRKRLGDPERVDVPVLDLVRHHDRGLVRYDPAQVQPARLIAQVARAWPRARVLVTVTRVSDARALRRQLEDLASRPSLFTGQHHPASVRRVATYNRVADGAIAIQRRDIYIALNATEVLASPNDSGIEGFKRLRRARAYGLLADGVAVAPQQRSWLTALFGANEVYAPRHGHKPLPVGVVFTRIAGGARPPDHRDDGVAKRFGSWRHHLRNRRIAHLFFALVFGNRAALRRQFPGVARHVPKRQMGGRIGVLVEGVEHGLELSRGLRRPLAVAEGVWTEGLSPEQLAALEVNDSEKRRTRGHVVVTTAGLARAGRFDVPIRADGGVGLPVLPEDWCAVPWAADTRLLVIDCNDRHHPVLRRWTRQRRHAYIEAGWNVAGVEPATPMDKFVAERPEVCG